MTLIAFFTFCTFCIQLHNPGCKFSTVHKSWTQIGALFVAALHFPIKKGWWNMVFSLYFLGRVSYRFVQVQFLFQPGHFRCKSVWHTHLPVHQRLMDSPGRTGISRGLKAINSVLDSFGVSNRKDMFVYKDSTGAVFYFRFVRWCNAKQESYHTLYVSILLCTRWSQL